MRAVRRKSRRERSRAESCTTEMLVVNSAEGSTVLSASPSNTPSLTVCQNRIAGCTQNPSRFPTAPALAYLTYSFLGSVRIRHYRTATAHEMFVSYSRGLTSRNLLFPITKRVSLNPTRAASSSASSSSDVVDLAFEKAEPPSGSPPPSGTPPIVVLHGLLYELLPSCTIAIDLRFKVGRNRTGDRSVEQWPNP